MSETSCGNMNGHVKNTDSRIRVDKIQLSLDRETAWALCNLLTAKRIRKNADCLETDQLPGLISLGSVLGRFLDHPALKNTTDKGA